MTFPRTFVFVALAATGDVTAAAAAVPFGAPAPLATSHTYQMTPVGNGYGPLPYGIYGNQHRFRARRSYGTGYHGRGTRTGGPSGGLPGRS